MDNHCKNRNEKANPLQNLTPSLVKCIAEYNRNFFHDDVIKWKHFCPLLSLCAGNSPVTGEFPSKRPVTRRFDVFFDLRLNKRLSEQPRRR